MDSEYKKKIAELKSKIKSFPDFPKKGILFWDIFSAISDGQTAKLLQNLLVETVNAKFPQVEAIIGLESRGFLFSFALAAELGVGCVPVRKKGKLPGDVASYKYDLEYGSDILEIQKNTIQPGLNCLIVDDLIATGGSLAASIHLLKTCGANVMGCLTVIELESLNGRKNIPDGILVHSLIKYD
ncbi:adenine phosphoribosyltransferase [Ostrinia furnacalis]|uniref:adenine phosphoribosyltransferase n=1 Tax=Ostrinia furnacalis TaxID=93504 RepID=UPI001039B098|nr:adenine phosphoribosyltransferase [Ostrinia furnacalis]